MKRACFIAVVLLTIPMIARAEDPAASRLPMQVDGPLKISPWRVAAEPAANTARDHYVNNPPPGFYYYNYYYNGGFGYSSPWYGSPYGFGSYGSIYYMGGRATYVNPYIYGRARR